MTQDPRPPSTARPPADETAASSPATRETEAAVRMMVLGAVVAVLAPLGGFLGGSMVGPARTMGDYDAMFVWMFAGLVVGGVGAVLVLLGLQRWMRTSRRGDTVEP